MKAKMKNKKGITLIALIITIVVLIILAAVTINMTLGNNGIFNRTKTAKEQYQNAEDYESTEIAKYNNEIDNYIENSRNSEKLKLTTYVVDTIDYTYSNYGIKTYDLTNIEGYENFNIENFFIELNSYILYGASSEGASGDTGLATPEITSYENGILTVNLPRHTRGGGHSVALNISILLIYIK